MNRALDQVSEISRSADLRIAGIGRALPEQRVQNEDLEKAWGLTPGWIARATGVEERRRVSGGENAITLGAAAANEALKDAGLVAEDLDLVLNASGTPHQAIPDNAPFILRALGLEGTRIAGFSIHATCASFLPALQIATQYLASRSMRNILVVSSEVTSCGINQDEPESAALMGDAAGAVVLQSMDENGTGSMIEAFYMETYPEGVELNQIRGGGTAKHPSNPNTIGDDHLFSMHGKSVARMIARELPLFVERLRPGLSRGLMDIDFVVPHQASQLGLALLARLGWPEDRVIKTLPNFGNCVAASIPVTLYEGMRVTRQIETGHKVLLISSGAGVSLAGAIVKI